jgi:F1F0 ATPase subunit 2
MTGMGSAALILYLLAGATLGLVYFAMLQWTVRLFTDGAGGSFVLPLYAVRIAAAVLVFWLVAQQGALPLLLVLLGFLIARIAVQRWGKTA